VTVTSASKVHIQSLTSSLQPETYQIYPELNNFDTNKPTQLQLLTWFNSSVYCITNGSTVTHCVLVAEEDENEETDMILWGYESFQMDSEVESLMVDPIVPNRYYLTCSGNVYAVSLPLNEANGNEIAEDGLPELPTAEIQHILQSGPKNGKNTSSKNEIYGLTSTDVCLFALTKNTLINLPKNKMNTKSGSQNPQNLSNSEINQQNTDNFKRTIENMLSRETSQPIILAPVEKSQASSPIAMAKLLRVSIATIKTEYLDKQKQVKTAIGNRESSLLERVKLLQERAQHLTKNQQKVRNNAEKIADRLDAFQNCQENLDEALKKIRKFALSGEQLSRSEQLWMKEAVKMEQMVVEYNVQIGRLKDRVIQMRVEEENEENIKQLNSGFGSINLEDSMQFSQIESNLRNNTEGVENLVQNLKSLSIQAGCFT